MNATTSPVLSLIEEKALATVTDFESGKRPLVMEEYIEAVAILKTSDINKPYLKFSPLLTPKIIAMLPYAQHSIYGVYFEPEAATTLMAGTLKLLRKLTLHCKDAPWREEMHIAGIFVKCRPHKFCTKKFIRETLRRLEFDEVSIKTVINILFKSPSLSLVYFEEGQDVNEWKQRTYKFLETMRKSPPPAQLIFIGIELGTIYFIKKELKRNHKKVWELSFLSQEEQRWYYGKITDILGTNPASEDVDDIIREFREVMLKIFHLL